MKTTIAEAVKKVFAEDNSTGAGRISNFLRAKGLNYNDQVALVNHIMGRDMSREWEGLMYESEEFA